MSTLSKPIHGHRHELSPVKSRAPFSCDGCKVLGSGQGYRCPHVKRCNYIVHKECHIPRPTISYHPFFKGCNFKFHKESPTGPGTRICDVCALDILGFSYQCSHGEHDLHPHCANLPRSHSLPDSDKKIYLCKNIKTKCLYCNREKRSSGQVKGFSYVSSSGELCYHVACLNEAHVENWRNGKLKRDFRATERSRSLGLPNPAANQVAPPRSSPAMNRAKRLFRFVKLVVSALFGDHITLVSTLYGAIQN